MKKILTLSIVCLFILNLPIRTQAQIWKHLKNKAKEAAERKIEEKASEMLQQQAQQMVEKSWTSVFGDILQDSTLAGTLPFKLDNNVTTEDSYHFDIVTTMRMESIRGNGKVDPPTTMLMHFNKTEQYTGTKLITEDMRQENGDLFIIYDFKNAAMLMLMQNDDNKFSFAYDWSQPLVNPSDSLSSNSQEVNWNEVTEWHGYSKIGSKNIAGYTCEGYQSQTDNAKTDIWVTRDADYGMENMFQANANTKQLRGKLPTDYPYGMLMEMTTENLETGDKTILSVISVQKDADITYNMADYPTMSLAMKQDK